MTRLTALAAVVLLVAPATRPAAGGQVKVSLKDGRATIVADQATPREILAEWARVGQVTVIDADKITGAPLSLQLLDVPEESAIESVLRAVGGYAAVTRAVSVQGASRYDRLFVFPVAARAVTSSPISSRPDNQGIRPRPGDAGGPDEMTPFGAGGIGMRPGLGRAVGPNDPNMDLQGPMTLRPMPEGAGGITTGIYDGTTPLGPPLPGGTLASPNSPPGDVQQGTTSAAPRPGMTVKPVTPPGNPPRPPGSPPGE